MLHPITHEFLSKAKEYDRLRQREACQLHSSSGAWGFTKPSRIQRGMDLLGKLLVHARERLRQARIELTALAGDRASS
jgi:hypothetical protein